MRREKPNFQCCNVWLTASYYRYWTLVHPQWAILDQQLYTPDFVQSRSALLTTVILALASTALATLSQVSAEAQVAEALKLHTHAEKLNLVVYSTRARSTEIVQAQIVRLFGSIVLPSSSYSNLVIGPLLSGFAHAPRTATPDSIRHDFSDGCRNRYSLNSLSTEDRSG